MPPHVPADPPAELVAARLRDPYPYFAWLRRCAPAHVERRVGRPALWQVSRYEDVRALLTDTRLSKHPGRVPGYVPGPAGLNRHLVHADPPDHTRLRALVNSAFVPRRIALLEPFITRVAHRLLDRIEHSVHVDLIADFAAPLTFRMICAILGVPGRLDTTATRETLMSTIAPGTSTDAARTERDLHDLLDALIDGKRSGSGGSGVDLLGALVRAGDESGAMSEEELRSTAYLLLLVGHDTTMNLIGNGMLALLDHPEQAARLAAPDPGPGFVASAVEELLRYDSPVRDATFRCAAAPIELHGQVIGAGEIVSLLIGSANRDGERFTEPDRLDLGRTANEHLAFGYGPHFCIGAALARLEGAVAFPLLLRRLGPVQLAKPADELCWRPARVMRGLVALPLVRRA
ncbi:cytochrome P450 family protein [Streptomyces avidinii]|uniref:Cytochrome P450 n=1 Tax=Streptomyces avidinii TaxID=1895 RepID=A0ABS4LG23_STRAV|nr:cytochrome P450 [Streptomyces avidinii]MBP2040981.1 cytochrome P450 [Streptomyces avidinii]GGZ05538.1 cytochrome P450 hydroxylase [Streptomyces avidinii]